MDIIVSTGPPHSMHLIARHISKAMDIPWIADFRDPWTRMFYFKHLSLSGYALKKHKKLEKKVLDDASAVVAVSPLVQSEFQEMTSTPVELITNGYDESDFADAVVESDGYFNITHTGLFASDGNPDVLWKVLAEKCAEDKEFSDMMRIRLVGKTDKEVSASIERSGLGKHIRDHGYQPHLVAVKEQKSASMLILPLRKEPEYKATIPGKLFEYMASGNPILGIGQTDGAMASIIGSTKTGTVADWDDEKTISEFIDNCWQKFKSGSSETEMTTYHNIQEEHLPERWLL